LSNSYADLRLKSTPASNPNFIEFSSDGNDLVVETLPGPSGPGKVVVASFKNFPRLN
jgi:hypothetical protein